MVAAAVEISVIGSVPVGAIGPVETFGLPLFKTMAIDFGLSWTLS